MPTIEIDYEDFQRLLRVELPKTAEEIDELLSYVKGEVRLLSEEEIHIEIKDSNRPDLWNVEGLARALQGFLGIERGLKRYVVTGSSGVEVHVDSMLKDIRPYIACAVVKDVRLNDVNIREAMHIQDKLDQTYGRKRRRTSIGLYDFDLVSPPLYYGAAKPNEVSFAPLGFEEKMTLKEILEKHPKGVEYGHIVLTDAVFPILLDSENKVLSFPPIVNSNDLGRITEKTRDVLIEVTGTRHDTVLNTLTIVALSLAGRGGKIYSAAVHYPYGETRVVVTPQLKTQAMKIDMAYVNKVLGLKLTVREAAKLLERARYGTTEVGKESVTVDIPCYRIDIMHPIDIVEDIAIAYGYNRIKPQWRRLPTTGRIAPEREFCDLTREIMVGLGFQEVLTFTLSNPENLFVKMNQRPEKVVEISNPKMLTFTCLRNWLLPSLMGFLSHNTHVEYPQRMFEVGYAVVFDKKKETQTRSIEKLACVTIHPNANFTEAKSVLDALFLNLGIQDDIKESKHSSFIEGRIGRILVNDKVVGIIGEIHPNVLEAWKLENPTAAFEINLNKIFRR